MKTFEEYLDKMGYSWNDFDRTYEMENLIEQYADKRVNQALRKHDVVGRSEQLPPCSKCGINWSGSLVINCPLKDCTGYRR